MTGWDKISWKPLGKGRQAPAGSIPSKKLAQKIADYKNRVAGRYRSLSPQDIVQLSGATIIPNHQQALGRHQNELLRFCLDISHLYIKYPDSNYR